MMVQLRKEVMKVNRKNKKKLPKLLFTNSKLNAFQKAKPQRNDESFGSIAYFYLSSETKISKSNFINFITKLIYIFKNLICEIKIILLQEFSSIVEK